MSALIALRSGRQAAGEDACPPAGREAGATKAVWIGEIGEPRLAQRMGEPGAPLITGQIKHQGAKV